MNQIRTPSLLFALPLEVEEHELPWTFLVIIRFPSVLRTLNLCATPKSKDFHRKLKKLWQVGMSRRYAVVQEG